MVVSRKMFVFMLNVYVKIWFFLYLLFNILSGICVIIFLIVNVGNKKDIFEIDYFLWSVYIGKLLFSIVLSILYVSGFSSVIYFNLIICL